MWCDGRALKQPRLVIPELLRLTVSPLSALLPGLSREAIYLGSWFSSCPSARCDKSTVVAATTRLHLVVKPWEKTILALHPQPG